MSKKLKPDENLNEIRDPDEFTFLDFSISSLTYAFILKHSSGLIDTESRGFFDIYPQTLELNSGSFTTTAGFPITEVKYNKDELTLTCPCPESKKRLCSHQAQVLFNIMDRDELRIFFDTKLRHEKLRKVALEYGLENEADPDDFFQVKYVNNSVEINPKLQGLLPINKATDHLLKEYLIPAQNLQLPASSRRSEYTKMIVVLGYHRFYNHLYIDLFEAHTTQEGKIKNPLKSIDPLDKIWKMDQSEELKFYTSISKFQNSYSSAKSESDIEGLKALTRNPLCLDIFYHDTRISANISANSIVPVKLQTLKIDLRLSVNQKNIFYEISGQLFVEDRDYDLKKLIIKYNYFIFIDGTLHLIDHPDLLRVIDFFRERNNLIVIHQSKFEEFRENTLSRLEHKIRISYSYLKPATQQQLEEQGFDEAIEKIIYLTDSEDYVIITPVLRYGRVEIPILSKKEIYAMDAKGNPFTFRRDEASEIQFVATLLKQHKDFEEQLNLDYFYLHKNRFLEADWFLEVFDEWQNQGITILGFNELQNNKLNPNKAKISILVSSGLDWFDTRVDVKYGKQKATLKHLHQSLRNKSKFVKLGDGTLGILPDEWIEKLSKFFQAAEIEEDSLRMPKISFSEITELYGEEVLTQEVKLELALYKSRISNFKAIESVKVPVDLKATLRDYQKQGLNWLNFLDEFNFGGCLADDMGLGKTIQVLAFILSQRVKGSHNTNLVIVPTSLIFNWQAEVNKFTPSIKIYTIYGADRKKDHKEFDQYEIILTSYGTLLTDIRYLKEYRFNYIFLDESQSIKNPESQRYQAVRLLQSRNKVVLTGTPIENNTFDIYGQLSFACPGLLGSKQHFKDHYSIPIDKFKDSRRAIELQKKINPFILRRTKSQVATELPEKTEMVIYCEMEPDQRKIYDSYAKEFYDFLMTKEEGDIPRNRMHVLQGLTKLRQICNSPALLSEDRFYGNSSSKINALMEQIESKSSDHKILIFSQFVTMLDLIKKELQTKHIPFEYLTGKTKNRSERVEGFQNNTTVRVFLISLKAGGTGLNLTEADYVYLVDPWWNPAVENQAIDRIYRIGQKKNVVAVRLICPNTIEEKIMKLQDSKKELVNDLIRTDTTILKSLSKKDLMGLFQKE